MHPHSMSNSKSRSILITAVCFVSAIMCQQLDIEIVTMGYPAPIGYTSLAFSTPAIDSAMAFLRSKYGEKFNFLHTYLYIDEPSQECDIMEAESSYVLSKWYYTRNFTPALTAFISTSEIPLRRQLLNVWNPQKKLRVLDFPTRRLPSDKWGCSASSGDDVLQRDKLISPTWISAGPVSATNYVLFPINLFKTFNWTNVWFVLDMDGPRVFQKGVAGVLKYVPQAIPDFQPTVRYVYSSTEIDYRSLLLEFNATSRIMFILGHSDFVRRTMLQAAAMNLTNGDYSYQSQEIFHSLVDFGNFSWQYYDQYDQVAREAYRSLFLHNGDPAVYKYPAAELKNRWKSQTQEQFNYTYGADEEVNPVATATYAAFAMFGQILSDTLDGEPDFDLTDGSTLAAQFFDMTFHLNFTDVYIDVVGERSTKVVVNDLNVTTGQWQAVMYQDESFRKMHKTGPIDWGGRKPHGSPPPLNEPVCGFRGNKGPCAVLPDSNSQKTYGIIFGTILPAFLLTWIGAFATIRHRRILQERSDFWFLLDRTQLKFGGADGAVSKQSKQSNPPKKLPKVSPEGRASYCDAEIWADKVPLPLASTKMYTDGDTMRQNNHHMKMTKQVFELVKTLREAPLEHINKFIGICAKPALHFLYLVSSFCPRGSLHDVFQKPFFEDQFRTSLIADLLEALVWLHSSPLRFHGALTGWKCLVDQHFTLKVAKVGYAQILKVYEHIYGELEKDEEVVSAKKLLWTAPEVLRKEVVGSPSSDVYATGIILNQIIWSTLPYAETENDHTVSETVEAVRHGKRADGLPARPLLAEIGNLALSLKPIVEACWQENHLARPTINAIKQQVFAALHIQKHGRRGLMDDICNRLKIYAETLEDDVAARTVALLAERRRCDELLRQMLPNFVKEERLARVAFRAVPAPTDEERMRSLANGIRTVFLPGKPCPEMCNLDPKNGRRKVVEQLRSGKTVTPEKFDSATIMFAKMCGFTEFSALKTPGEVTKVLNNVYSLFDERMTHFDAYKVETIGECYMVASGLPVRNGEEHVYVIALLALDFQKAFRGSEWRASLTLQSGINSGPCVTGVVGSQKPRYCLFGDTVNTASRMESTASPGAVQISQDSKSFLDKRSHHLTISMRGTVEVKGKGEVVTYWLS